MIVTVLPDPAPLVMVAVPLLFTCIPPASCIEITAPVPPSGSGWVAGNEVSFAIATKPPIPLIALLI